MTVVPWTRKHRSDFERWPSEPERLLPLYLLGAADEPSTNAACSFAVVVSGAAVGRFTVRYYDDSRVLVGLVLSPAVRGQHLSAAAFRAGLHCLALSGVCSAVASVALANVASFKMIQRCGFVVDHLESRVIPSSVDLSLLDGLPSYSYSLAPVPAVVYTVSFLSLGLSRYAGVAQQ